MNFCNLANYNNGDGLEGFHFYWTTSLKFAIPIIHQKFYLEYKKKPAGKRGKKCFIIRLLLRYLPLLMETYMSLAKSLMRNVL